MSEIISRSKCAVARTLDLVGDKWTLLIVRDLLNGKTKYGEFAGSREAIPSNILASRLKSLVGSGLLERVRYSERPPKYEYRLTEKGLRLGGLGRFVRDWGKANLEEGKTELKA